MLKKKNYLLKKQTFAKKMNEQYHFGICVNPDDPEEISTTITWLKEHPEQALEFGKNGRNAIEKEFNWENESEKLVAFYNQLLADSH